MKLHRLTDRELALNFLLTEWQAAYSYLVDGEGKVIAGLQHQIVDKVVRITKERDSVRRRILTLVTKLNLN